MRITEVEPIVLRLPDLRPDDCDGTQDTLLVRVHTDEGLIGIGEADTSPEIARAVVLAPISHLIARGLREVLIGQDPFDVVRLWHDMYHASIYYGRQGVALQAMSAVDIALWDLIGQASDRPVWSMLGGRHRERVRVYASLLMPERPDEIAPLVAPLLRRGFTAVKFGWGPLGRDEGLDVELIAAARQAIGPDRLLLIDAGWAYTVKGAARICRHWEPYDLFWLEEPLPPDDLAGYARLSDLVGVRIATGEEESGVRAFRRLIEEGHVDIIQPDVSRAGGFTECRRIGDLVEELHARLVPHAFKTGILQAASLHLAASLPHGDLCELTVHGGPLARTLTNIDFLDVLNPDGTVTIPSSPGLGVVLNEETMARYRVSY
ncbi:MAG: mandelate racemase/muconate lactonizing enzyme family protein [Chloroflexota bacterium]